VAVLSTAGGAPHAIPVSTAVRAGDRRVLLALAPRRSSLARLRADPRVALTILAAGDVAVSAEGRARVVAERLPGAEAVVAVAVDVESVQDHNQPTFAIDDGVRWRWTDPAAADRDAAVREALRALAARLD
jgi:Pyridoxamine 5'-phosphate oxidase